MAMTFRSLMFGGVLVCLLFLSCVQAIGCGEPIPSGAGGNPCTDWQCSRNQSGYCVRGNALGEPCASNADCYLQLQCAFWNGSSTNGTCVKESGATKNVGIGLLGAVLGVLCFGSTFVPIKKYKRFAGDGVFAQFLMNFGRFLVGAIIMFTRENRWFYWQAAGGGALWSLGNALGVPIVQCIGIGLGVSIWGSTNMILGWASGHFGLMGVKPESAERPYLEYLGVAFAFVSIFLFLFVKPVQQMQHQTQKPEPEEESEQNTEDKKDAEKLPLVAAEDAESMKNYAEQVNSRPTSTTTPPASPTDSNNGYPPPPKATMANTLGAKRARIIGVTMSLIAGALFGICMNPAQRLMSNFGTLSLEEDVKVSPYGFEYVFSNNCGALMMSSCLLIIHSTLRIIGKLPTEKYFDPVNYEKLLIPAIVSGAIGSCGSAAWFFANQNLGLIVSFPIIAAGPGVVSSLWGALVFKEIKGVKNFVVLALAFACVISGGVCSSLSQSS